MLVEDLDVPGTIRLLNIKVVLPVVIVVFIALQLHIDVSGPVFAVVLIFALREHLVLDLSEDVKLALSGVFIEGFVVDADAHHVSLLAECLLVPLLLVLGDLLRLVLQLHSALVPVLELCLNVGTRMGDVSIGQGQQRWNVYAVGIVFLPKL